MVEVYDARKITTAQLLKKLEGKTFKKRGNQIFIFSDGESFEKLNIKKVKGDVDG